MSFLTRKSFFYLLLVALTFSAEASSAEAPSQRASRCRSELSEEIQAVEVLLARAQRWIDQCVSERTAGAIAITRLYVSRQARRACQRDLSSRAPVIHGRMLSATEDLEEKKAQCLSGEATGGGAGKGLGNVSQ